MAFKIKDGVRVGLTDVFNNAGNLLVDAPRVASRTGDTYISAVTDAGFGDGSGADDNVLRFVTDGQQRLSISTNTATLNGSIGTFNINGTTESSNTTTGVLVVAGGVGIGGNLNVGGSATFSSIQNTPIGSVTRSTGAFTTLDADNIRVSGNTISSTNEDGDITLDPDGTGAVRITGTNGLVIPSGNTAERAPNSTGAIRFNSQISQFEGYDGTNWASLGGVRSVDGLTYITAESTPSASDDILRFYTADSNSTTFLAASLTKDGFVINGTTQSTDKDTGALIVEGGAGIEKNLNVGGDANITGNSTVSGNLTVLGTVSMGQATFTSIDGTPIGQNTAAAGSFTTLTASSGLVVTATTESTNKDTGAIIVEGGVGIEKRLNVGGNIATNGDLDVKGGTITQNNTVAIEMTGSDVEVRGDLTVTGDDVYGSTNKVMTFDGSNVQVAGNVRVGTNVIEAGDGADAITLYNTTGNVDVMGDLKVGGNDILSSTGGTAITMSGTDVKVGGDLTVGGNTIKSYDNINGAVAAIELTDNDVNVLGDADIDGNLLVNGTAQIDGNTIIGDDAFKVFASSGNTEIAGTMALAGTLTVNTDKFQVQASTGNTSIAGTLTVNDASTFNANMSLGGYKITNLADPTNAQDAATKAYVDAARAGLDVKQSVMVATTANVTLNGTQTIDGVSLTGGERVLVKNQTIASQNGIYVVNGAGAWSRATDADDTPTPGAEVTNGMFCFVEQGTVNGKTGFVLVTPDNITLGTTNLEFALFTVSGTLVAGNGLSKNGDMLEVNVASTGGIEISSDNLQLKSTVAGNGLTWDASTSGILNVVGTADRITVNADSVDIASTYAGQDSIVTLGTISTGTWQGSIVSPTYGGTGINNGSKTITLGGSLTTSGAYDTTITMTANTAVTMPTSGTLATLANTETLTNKTINASNIGVSDPGTAAFTTLTASGLSTITNSTSSSNTTTGAFVVTGGVGIGENLNVGGDLTVGGQVINRTVGGAAITADEVIQFEIATTSPTVIDSFSATDYRSAKYLIQISQGSDYQLSEFRVIHSWNGVAGSVYVTEYAVLETNGPLASAFTASVAAGTLSVSVTMNSATNATVNMVRTTVVV